jgi:glycine cleavage system H protein
MYFPKELKYTRSHEWVRFDGARATVGISDYAQSQLGDVVVFELPKVGATLTSGQSFAVVESVKAVSSVYAPVSGVVVEINDKLVDAPETVNHDAYGEGWIAVIELDGSSGVEELFDSKAYARLIAPEENRAAGES